jgi:ribosomal protein L7/L12
MTDNFQSLLNASKEMLQNGQEREAILTYIRHSGGSKIDAIRLLVVLQDLSLPEAKRVVHFSDAWSDTRERDEEFHDQLERVAKLDEK